MDFLDEMGVISEVPERKTDSESGFSVDSLDKFDELMGDDKIESKPADEFPNLTPAEAENKFNKLFDANEGNEKKELTEEEKLQKIQDFIDRKTDFEEVKEIFVEYYSGAVNSNKPWAWNEDIPGGDNLTGGQKKAIREYAREKALVPAAPTYEKDGKTYADFSLYKVFKCILEKEDWDKSDSEQFVKCNEMLKKSISENPELTKQFTEEQLEQIEKGETSTGYTWHHSEKDGTMQLVPYGVHHSTNHCGGRSEGNWADAPR